MPDEAPETFTAYVDMADETIEVPGATRWQRLPDGSLVVIGEHAILAEFKVWHFIARKGGSNA